MLVSTLVSAKIANNLNKMELIEEKEIEIYAYCLDYLLENIIFSSTLILIGIFFHAFPISILFLFIFILRSFTGGYHAPTQKLCTLLSYSCFMLTIFIVKLLEHIHLISLYSLIVLYILSSICIFLFAPVEHKNKQFSESMRQSLRQKSRLYLSIITIANCIFFCFNLKLYYTTTTICVMIIAINLLVAYKTYHKEEKQP